MDDGQETEGREWKWERGIRKGEDGNRNQERGNGRVETG